MADSGSQCRGSLNLGPMGPAGGASNILGGHASSGLGAMSVSILVRFLYPIDLVQLGGLRHGVSSFMYLTVP